MWAACLLFFQVVLLLGYLYAHLLIRYLRPRVQVAVHLGLLVVSALLVLTGQITPREFLKPTGIEEPIGHILLLLGLTVGLPYFVLSTTGPLLQAWYAQRAAGLGLSRVFPYRFYSLSNLGSMLALLSYPVLVEPLLRIRQQAGIWSGAYLLFVLLCGSFALRIRRDPTADLRAENEAGPAGERERPGAPQYLVCLALAACTSTLLLAVTNHVSQNVAAVPFLWVLPLSLYLLSFIVCFAGKTWRWRKPFLPLPAVSIVAMAYMLSAGHAHRDVGVLLPVWMAGLFLCCLLCHGELSRRKPGARYLTAFYLMLSIGGALGGVFVGLLAPRVFNSYYELPIAIGACAVVALFVVYHEAGGRWWEPIRQVLCGLTVALIVYIGSQARASVPSCRLSARSFYGVLHVCDRGQPGSDGARRELTHGTILHGNQFLSRKKRTQPTTYYGPKSGIGRAIRLRRNRGAERVGVIGLGTGTLAAYGRPGDRYLFYEINPQVVQIARTQFHYLSDSKADVAIVLGDARLALERQPGQNFDVLAVDAFSSDAIPVHLLTREAFAVYFKHLKPDGVLAVHTSNRYVDLQPVVRRAAEAMNKTAVVVLDEDNQSEAISASEWILVTDRRGLRGDPLLKGATKTPQARAGFRGWTDDYSNLFQLLR